MLVAAKLYSHGKEQLRLAEKIAKVQEQTETPEEAATLLKDVMTGEENSKAHGQHKTWLKSNQKKRMRPLTKGTRDLLLFLWLVKQNCPKFCTLQHSAAGLQAQGKREAAIRTANASAFSRGV